ncbi:MAG: VCBS repeat-containing protein [Opitutaceae bacterium]|nr:VCBS repeat-containing protein [Opitutaceae bacterium]
MKASLLLLLGGAVWAAAPAAPAEPAVRTWTTSGHADFVAGRFADAGANSFVTAAGDLRLINEWDLNRDGYLDLFFFNTHDNNQQIDAFVYWGGRGYAVDARTRLPSDGGAAVAAGDLNGDGFADLVLVNNFNGVKTNLDSYVYWGGRDGFDPARRTALPTLGATAAAIADLNGDGRPDVVFANSGRAYGGTPEKGNRSLIYWGGTSGLAAESRASLPTAIASDVKVADLNCDGTPEIIFANEGGGGEPGGLLIYWGQAGVPHDPTRVTRLPGVMSSAVAVADLDRDGWPDLALANRYLPLTRPPGDTRELDTDVAAEAILSTVYWGGPAGFAPERRTGLPTLAASSVAAGDLDGDGWAELVFANGPRRAGHATPSPGIGSYVYWGGPDGFAPSRRSVVATMNPTHCAIEDLDGDGHADLLVSNENDARSFATRSFVYRGGPGGPDFSRRLELPTLGAGGVAAADFDGDGKKDLVFANKMDGSAGEHIPAYFYWGNARGEFSVARRHELLHPIGSPGEGYAAADLDNDGWVDLYTAGPESAIYWGGAPGFSPARKTLLSSQMAFSGRAADFDRDGWLDLLLSDFGTGGTTRLLWGSPKGFAEPNRFTFPLDGPRCQSIADLDGDGRLDVVFPTVNHEVVIFWSGPEGFDPARRTVLPAGLSIATEIADLNRDGRLDLVVTNMRSAGDDPTGSTYLYWGTPDGFRVDRRQVLASPGVEDVLVADLNRDGHLDLVLASYHAGETRSHPSYLYWGGPDGFSPARLTQLPTHSASGALAADFNRDGHPDLLFTCHTQEGSHRNDSYLYWGGPQGFSPERRTLLPGLGPHLLTVTDIGDVRARTDRFDYYSRVFDAGTPCTLESLSWEGDTPFATRLEFQVRAADTPAALAAAPWTGSVGSTAAGRKASLAGLALRGRYLQFKATLVSPDGANTPVLRAVSIGYRE